MRILAFDNSSNRVGWALFDNKELKQYGLIELEKLIKQDDRFQVKDYFERILLFREIIVSMCQEHKADLIVFEDVILNSFGNNKVQVDTFRKLVEVLMACQLTCIDQGFQCMIVPANIWRKGLQFGRKREEIKANTIKHVNRVFGLEFREYDAKSKDNDDDICDSIMIGNWASKNAKRT